MISGIWRYLGKITLAAGSLMLTEPALPQCEIAAITAGDGSAGDRFGSAVAISGDYAVVGAHNSNGMGAAYVFERDGLDWVEAARLDLPEGTIALDDEYGRAVAIDGNVAVVGAAKHDVTPMIDAGAAYVFRRDGGTWQYEAELTAYDAFIDDQFGYSVAVDGDEIVVGAPNEAGPYSLSKSGTVYVFKYDGVDSWDFQRTLRADDPGTSDYFGRAVSISGDWIVVGAEQEDPLYIPDAGAAYVFRRIAAPVLWDQDVKLTAQTDAGEDDMGDGDKFGNAVSIDGDRLVVGARTHDGMSVDSGAAYVYWLDDKGTPSTIDDIWAIEKKLTSTDPARSYQFGRAVSVSGDLILVGSRDSVGTVTQAGSAYLFRRHGYNWEQVEEFENSEPESRDFFGDACAVGDDYAVVGAFLDDENGTDSGSAYIFRVTLGEDCNNNGVPDECDLVTGASEDVNANGIPDECECATDADCDDGLACTIDTCDSGSQRCMFEVMVGFCAIAGTCHPDGDDNPNNECEACDAARNPDDWTAKPYGSPCTPDDLVCTDDVCDPSDASCVHVLVSGFCAIDDACYAEGTTNPEADCEVCTPTLDPEDWSLKPDGTLCTDDGLFCTGMEACLNGVCESPGDPCVDLALFCDETTDECLECLSAADCDDSNDCTTDVCDAGACAYPNSPVGTPCGDPSDTDCTAPDTCDGAGVCLANHMADETPCTDDGAFCTGEERCLDGTCQSSGDPCFDLGLACKEETDECLADCNGNDVPDDQDIADGTSDDCNENGIPDECEIPGPYAATVFATGIGLPEEIKPSQGDYPPGFFVGGYSAGEYLYHVLPEGGEAIAFSEYRRSIASVLFVPDEFGGAGIRLLGGGHDGRVYEFGTDGSVSNFFSPDCSSNMPTGLAYVPLSFDSPVAGKLLVSCGDTLYAVAADGCSAELTWLPVHPFSITLAPTHFGGFGGRLFVFDGSNPYIYELNLQTLELNLFAVVPDLLPYIALRQGTFSPIGWAAPLNANLTGESILLISATDRYDYTEGLIMAFDQRGRAVAFMTRGPGGHTLRPRGMTFVGSDLFISNFRGGTVVRATVEDFHADCNMNGLLDECEGLPDCNENGVPDICEPDCNHNGAADECDISDGISVDDDANGIPDECELLYVDASGTGANDGSSWIDAFVDLQSALHIAAEVNSEVKEIWVAAGTYTPDHGGGPLPDERIAAFQLVSGVSVYGGFEGADSSAYPGGETSIDQRDPTVNLTVLSGDLNGDDGPDLTNRGDNSLNVVTADHLGPSAVLDGFTITGGAAGFAPGAASPDGGGMACHNASPTLRNCVFFANSALNHGGGMYSHESSPRLSGCLFSGNVADYYGGGMAVSGGSLTLTNCSFMGNDAIYGGAFASAAGSPLMINNLFLANSASSTGGAIYVGESDLTVWNSTFAGNSAPEGGCAAASVWEPWDEPSSIEMTNCILWDGGDEIFNDDGSRVTITYSDVQGGWLGRNNIDEDPLFVDPLGPDGTPGTDDDDLRLSPGSPCIDAGDNEALPVGVTTDLDGHLRFVDDPTVSPDPGHGIPPIVDMGAYEYQPLLVVSLDVFPGICPNRLSSQRKGVLRMALTGDESFDVTAVDLDAIVLTRADGVGGAIRPLMEPSGLAPKLIDVTTPFDDELCDCHHSRKDGTTDLLLCFSAAKMRRALQLESVPAGDFATLTLRGRLRGGAQFEAADCVLMVGPPPRPDRPGDRYKARFR